MDQCKKKAHQEDHLGVCPLESGWLTNSQVGMVAKEKENLLGIKGVNKDSITVWHWICNHSNKNWPISLEEVCVVMGNQMVHHQAWHF
jgi:hypothetical protein